MKSYEWVLRVKEECGITSDNQVAITLDLTRAAISDHKNGRAHSFADEQCVKIADLLGIEPITVIADQRAEGAKNPNIKAVWERVKKGIVVVPRDGIEPPTRGFSISKAKTLIFVNNFIIEATGRLFLSFLQPALNDHRSSVRI